MLIAMRSHRRRGPVDHILIAGQIDDLPCIRAALAILAADSYGQVFIEAPADTPLDLVSPFRVSIHRVDEGCLADAIEGWVGEWVPDETDPHRRVAVWVGSHAISQVASTYQQFAGLVDQL